MKYIRNEHTLSGRTIPALVLIVISLAVNIFIGALAPQTPDRPVTADSPRTESGTIGERDVDQIIEQLQDDPVRVAVINFMSIMTLAVFVAGIAADIRFFRKQFRYRRHYGHILSSGFPNSVATNDALTVLALIFAYYTMAHLLMLTATLILDKLPMGMGLGINAVLELAVIFTIFGFMGGGMIRVGRKLIRQIPRLIEIYIGLVPLLTAAFLITSAISGLLGIEPQPMPVIRMMIEEKIPVIAIVLLAVEAIVLAPIAEELLFRGVIFGTLRRFGSFGFAALVTAIIFSALHGHIFSFLPIAVLGIAFAHYYEKTRNIAWPIMLHALYNAISVLMVLAYRYVLAGVN
jgi:membrane protease YdiL (CAAX protease family)